MKCTRFTHFGFTPPHARHAISIPFPNWEVRDHTHQYTTFHTFLRLRYRSQAPLSSTSRSDFEKYHFENREIGDKEDTYPHHIDMSPHQKMKEQGGMPVCRHGKQLRKERQAKKGKTVRRHRERDKKERSRLRDFTSGPGNFQEEASENSGDEQQHPEDSVSGDQTEKEWCGGVFVDHRFESWMEEGRILDVSESGDDGQRDAETTNHGTNLIPQPHFDLTEVFTEDEDEMRKATSTSPGAEEDEGFDEM